MVEIELPSIFNEDFIEKIPEQRYMINKLIEKGTIVSYSLAADRSKLWATMNAANAGEIKQIVRKMPLYEYFVNYNIHDLLFTETMTGAIPQISLN